MVGGKLTGSGTVKRGKLNLSHKLDKDLITEGDETLELKLFTDAERQSKLEYEGNHNKRCNSDLCN